MLPEGLGDIADVFFTMYIVVGDSRTITGKITDKTDEEDCDAEVLGVALMDTEIDTGTDGFADVKEPGYDDAE